MCRLCSSVEHKCWQPNSWQEPLTSIAWTNTIEVSGHQQLFGYQHFPKNHLVFGRRKKLVQVWNNLRLSKWWEISLLLTKILFHGFNYNNLDMNRYIFSCINLCYLTDTLLLWSLVYIWIAWYNSCLLCKYGGLQDVVTHMETTQYYHSAGTASKSIQSFSLLWKM